MELSAQQRAASDRAFMMNSGLLFITGKAGTGKSTVLRDLRNRQKLIVLAPTGLAAVNVGGQTIHSFFGLLPGPIDPAKMKALPSKKRFAIEAAGKIVIDEVSMVRADLMDGIDMSLRKTMESGQPFGGVPIVAFGDLYQIEPVIGDDAEAQMLADTYESHFFFDSNVLSGGAISTVQLDEVFRQQGDPEFIEALNAVRVGDVDPSVPRLASKCALTILNRRVSDRALMHAVWLTMTNNRAGQINEKRLALIDAPATVYEADDDGEWKGETPAPRTLTLKPGARVMTVSNKREQFSDRMVYSNGDLGYVRECHGGSVDVELDGGKVVNVETNKWERLKYDYEKGVGLTAEVVGSFQQIPLKLAWAATVHKSQGQTYDRAHLLLEIPGFAHGQAYVALSRCRSLAGMTLARPLRPADVVVRPRVNEWLAGQRQESTA